MNRSPAWPASMTLDVQRTSVDYFTMVVRALTRLTSVGCDGGALC